MSENNIHLVVLGHGGLGNRLAPLLSSLSIAEKTGAKVKSLWIKDRTCDIECDKLFDEHFLPTISLEEVCSLKPKMEHRRKNSDPIKAKLYKALFLPENNSGSFEKGKGIAAVVDSNIENGNNSFIDTHAIIKSKHTDCGKIPELFSKILVKELRGRILQKKKELNLNKEIIGSHLRGTDCVRKQRGCKGKSDKVIERIKREKDKTFFVCSDEKELEERLANCPNVILNNKNSYVGKATEGKGWMFNCLRNEDSIIEAMIDMCCLSFCNLRHREYISVGNSTFSRIARTISGWEKFE